jgi:hypothetical protein
MTDRPTDEELDRWLALAEAATPGPWKRDLRPTQHIGIWADVITVRPNPYEPDADPEGRLGHLDLLYFYPIDLANVITDANASFVAAAREAVPKLIAEVRRLREGKSDER